MSLEEFLKILPALLAGAASWGGVRQALNGTKEKLDTLGKVLDRVSERVDIHAEKIAKLEVEKNHLKDAIRSVEKRTGGM
jgi:hypothetical protein